MTPFKTGFFAAAVAVALTAGWQHHAQQQRRDEAARLRAENEQLRLRIDQRPESPVVPSRASGAEKELAAETSGTSARAVAKELRSAAKDAATPGAVAEYRNEGMATPLATLQTLAWACDRADAELMERLLVFDEDAREKITRHFSTQNAGTGAKMPPVEAAAAALYIEDGMHHPYPGATILELGKFEQLRTGRVRLHLPGANGDGYEFQQTADGWKLAISMAVVDDYIRQSAKRSSKP